MKHQDLSKLVFILLAIICLTPWIDSTLALLMGILLSFILGNPFQSFTKTATQKLLQISIIGLGFSINLNDAIKAGTDGIILMIVSISSTLIIGTLLSRLFKVDRKTAHLISSGTAICGGSAIAAMAPAIQAKSSQISVSLGVVFLLNSVALFLFPNLGHLFHLNEHQFGLWAATAIHDTSSVVGAAGKYGNIALTTATTVKLTRALWIIPLTLISGYFFRNNSRKVKLPYFIFLFFLAILLGSFIGNNNIIFHSLSAIAKKGLVVTLFLIGTNLSPADLKEVGTKPLMMGITLWIAVSILTFTMIMGLPYFLNIK
ncbi:MAG: putative sulfate exporter family transporter [Bacteroidota bacterium]|nr:putative sulfate exporter family transporter [Bacteroidota bacterium]